MSDNISEQTNEAVVQTVTPSLKYTLTESIFAVVFTFTGYFFIKAFFTINVGIAAALFMLAVGGLSLAYVKANGAKQSKSSIAFFITFAIFSANLAVSSNELIQFLDFIFAAAMLAMWAYTVNNFQYKGADDYIVYSLSSAIFKQSFRSIGKCPSAAAELTKRSKGGRNIRNAVIGLIIALPVTLIVISLLSSADENFSGIIEGITDNIINNCLSGILKYFLALPISFLIFGIAYSAVKTDTKSRLDEDKCQQMTSSFKIAPAMVMYFSVIPLCLVYMLFFFSQISYFTSAFRSVLPTEFSAAEYARKGFFELCAVSVINLTVIIAINLLCRYNENADGGKKRPAALKFFTMLICIFTLILIATAVSKMLMYISRFGLTQLRVYTTWFMLVLTVLFVLIAIRQFKQINIAKIGAIIFTIMLGLLSFSQTDALIARYNISAFENGYVETIDFSDISSDGIYSVAPLITSENKQLKDAAEDFITAKFNYLKYDNWYEHTVSERVLLQYANKVCKH